MADSSFVEVGAKANAVRTLKHSLRGKEERRDTVSKGTQSARERALGLLGPLERRIMREVWSETVAGEFVVRDVLDRMPELAYTTVMTTLNRLADKGMLAVTPVRGQRAHAYHVTTSPEEFLIRGSRDQVARVVEQFGDTAIAAFAERLDGLSTEQLTRLRKLAE